MPTKGCASFLSACYVGLAHLIALEGIDVGLINKTTLNIVDEEILAKIDKAPFVLVVEAFNRKTGLDSRLGSWLLERGL